jgi:uncharacterized lipoprotein YehR (DUF1307 family)
LYYTNNNQEKKIIQFIAISLSSCDDRDEKKEFLFDFSGAIDVVSLWIGK